MKLAWTRLPGDSQRVNSVDYAKFLEAFCLNVEELDPNDFVETPVKDELDAGLTQLAAVNAKVEKVDRQVKTEEDIDYLLDLLRDLKAERDVVAGRVEELAYKVRNPVRQSVVEMQEVIRVKPGLVKAKLRMVVKDIWVLIGMDGLEKQVTVQIHFRTGLVRKYWFSYRATRGQSLGSINYKSTISMVQEHPVMDLRNWREVHLA